MATLRSSNRAAPRRRYTIDAFEGIEELQSDISSHDEEETQQLLESDEEDEDVFDAAQGPPSDADDEPMSGLDDDADGIDGDLASDAGERDLEDDVSVVNDSDDIQAPPERRHRTKMHVKNAHGQRVFIRGVPDDESTGMKSLSLRRLALYGSANEDFEPVHQAFARWRHDPCLPTRSATENGQGGFAYSRAFEAEVDKADSNWIWYASDGEGAFRQRQVLKPLPVEDVHKYIQIDGTGERSFVMGPLSDQRFFRLQYGQFIALSDAFQSAHDGTRLPANHKSGFVLNVGARVKCLNWAPNQRGTRQYLALSVLSKTNNNLPSGSTSAFTAQPASDANIQIWEVNATQDNYIDTGKPLRLSVVLCAAMGHVKDLKWCPVPSKQSSQLGLMGCVTADGALRVFDVALPASHDATTYVLVEKPAFMVKPPGTICTSLTWLSSSRIAASCANGFVATWNLAKPPVTSDNPRPEQYLGLSTSYITSMVTGYPSFPNMLITNSVNGYLTLTDLDRPNPASPMGTALSPRTRLSQMSVIWHEPSHMAMSCEDNLTIRAHPLRRFFGSFSVNRLKSHATSMAASPCHPFVLVGTAGGEVVSHNAIERLVYGMRVDHVLQPWFLHEWRRPNKAELKAAETAPSIQTGEGPEDDFIKSIIGQHGLTRIADDLKSYRTTLATKDGNAPNFRSGVQFNTIHEEKSAVTSVAWNPNLHVGGWAAAGMADGLLRIEDVAT